MRFGNLRRGELISIVGGVVLAISVFLAWYRLGNGNAKLSGVGPGEAGAALTAWQALTVMRYLFLAAAVAPIILAYIIVREHALSWPRGEVTAVVAVIALGLVILRGILIRPGDPPGEIGLQYGWFVALAGGALMLTGAVIRTSEVDRGRKPPGVP